MTPETSTTAPVVSREIIAHDFEANMHGKLDAAKIAAGKEKILTTTTGYGAVGSIASAIIHFWVYCNITNGEDFKGEGWGLGTPGGGWIGGTVYTDNLALLYSNTTNVYVTAAIAYTAFYFYDSNSNLLGTFQGGSVSSVAAQFGCGGSWS